MYNVFRLTEVDLANTGLQDGINPPLRDLFFEQKIQQNRVFNSFMLTRNMYFFEKSQILFSQKDEFSQIFSKSWVLGTNWIRSRLKIPSGAKHACL